MTAKAIEKKIAEKRGMTTKPLTAKQPKSTIVEKVESAIKSIDSFLATGRVERCIWGLIKSIARLFSAAIVLVVLASIAPELREQLPSLYLFVDALLGILEWILGIVCDLWHIC